MVTEKQKYLSVSLRTSGFALFAPLGSLVFQWVVFKKDLFLGNLNAAMIIFLLGFIMMIVGYWILQEK